MRMLILGFAAWCLVVTALFVYFVNISGNNPDTVLLALCELSSIAGLLLLGLFAQIEYRQTPEFLCVIGSASAMLYPTFTLEFTIFFCAFVSILLMLLRLRIIDGCAMFASSLGIIAPCKMLTWGSEDGPEAMITIVIVTAVLFTLSFVLGEFAFQPRKHNSM